MRTVDPENNDINPTQPNDSTCEKVRNRRFGSWLASAEGRRAIVCIALVSFFVVPGTAAGVAVEFTTQLSDVAGDPHGLMVLLKNLIAFCILPCMPLILVLIGAVIDYRRWKRGDEEPSENQPEEKDYEMENAVRPGGDRYGWPRFDDGSPVSIGDAVEIPGLPGVAMLVEAIEANREGVWVKDAPEGDFHTAVPASYTFQRPRSLEADAPAHAVETCRMEFDTVHHDYKCSACDAFVRTDASRRLDGSASLKYCPNCGRKVTG